MDVLIISAPQTRAIVRIRIAQSFPGSCNQIAKIITASEIIE
jgi:hypothetical protein